MYCILVIVVAVSLDCVWFAVCFLVLTKWGKVSAGSRHGVRVRHGFLAGLFHDLVVIQPLTSIWVAFGMSRTDSTTSTTSVGVWGRQNL